jgi:hypothetical protein
MTDVIPGPMSDADEEPGTAEPATRVDAATSRATSIGEIVVLYVLCIAGAVALAMMIVWATGGSPRPLRGGAC